jgi:thiosulfate dehydrogenase (quinone) large subunit
VFVFAWTPFVIAGAEGQPSVDMELARRARPSRRAPEHATGLVTRRVLLRQALLGAGAATLGIAGIAYAAKGSYHRAAAPTLSARRPRPVTRRRAAKRHHTRHSNLPSGAVRLGPSNALQPGHAATYRDPADGRPDVLVRDTGGQLTAMSAVCTHAGCEVSYQSGQLVCPCHGSVFNARTGAVEQGPASQPLAIKHVTESGGEIYAVPT